MKKILSFAKMKLYNKYYILQMDYFTNYKSCKAFYNIYNYNLKCREFLEYYKDIVFAEFILNDVFHNIKGPAYVIYNDDGSKSSEEYCINGLLHNIKGPAYVIYNDDGSKSSEEYYINGEFHNENSPAVIHYKNNKVFCEEYWINGKRHNTTGPAYIKYYSPSHVKHYYIDGKELTKKKFNKTRK